MLQSGSFNRPGGHRGLGGGCARPRSPLLITLSKNTSQFPLSSPAQSLSPHLPVVWGSRFKTLSHACTRSHARVCTHVHTHAHHSLPPCPLLSLTYPPTSRPPGARTWPPSSPGASVFPGKEAGGTGWVWGPTGVTASLPPPQGPGDRRFRAQPRPSSGSCVTGRPWSPGW